MGLYLGSEIKGVYCGSTEVKEAYVGGVKVYGKQSEDFIYDDFVLLDNGVNKSGLFVNDGSFGNVLYDLNGWVEGGNTPYYARANFSGDDGAVKIISNSLISAFLENWTFEFWAYFETVPYNSYVVGAYNNDRSGKMFEFKIHNNYGINASSLKFCQITRSNDPIEENKWHHIAISMSVDSSGAKKAFYFIDGVRILGGNSLSNIPTDINTIMFRFAGDAGGVRISQVALRNKMVWNSNFTPPTKLYKQR